MYQATEKIYNALKETGTLKVFTDTAGDASTVRLDFGLNGGGSYRMSFISHNDNNDVAVRVYGLVSISEEKRADMLSVVNQLNCQFRFVKFCIDDDGDINVQYDFPVECSDPAESAFEIVIRFMNIIKEAYPQMMRVIWSD